MSWSVSCEIQHVFCWFLIQIQWTVQDYMKEAPVPAGEESVFELELRHFCQLVECYEPPKDERLAELFFWDGTIALRAAMAQVGRPSPSIHSDCSLLSV